VTLERCGHVPQVEQAAQTNQLLLSFFARAEGAQAGRAGIRGDLGAVA
jgi:hypothetical protein